MTAIEALVEAGDRQAMLCFRNALLFQDLEEEPMVIDLDQQKGKPAKGNIPLIPEI